VVVLVSWLYLLMTTAFALFILGVADVFFSPFSVLHCHGQLKDEMARLQDIQSSDVFILTNEMKRLRSQQDINVENEQYAIAIRMRLVSVQLAHRHIGTSAHWCKQKLKKISVAVSWASLNLECIPPSDIIHINASTKHCLR
jgi:hypothetical protein